MPATMAKSRAAFKKKAVFSFHVFILLISLFLHFLFLKIPQPCFMLILLIGEQGHVEQEGPEEPSENGLVMESGDQEEESECRDAVGLSEGKVRVHPPFLNCNSSKNSFFDYFCSILAVGFLWRRRERWGRR